MIIRRANTGASSSFFNSKIYFDSSCSVAGVFWLRPKDLAPALRDRGLAANLLTLTATGETRVLPVCQVP